MEFKDIGAGVSISSRAWGENIQDLFPKELISLLADLHTQFQPQRKKLLEERISRQKVWDSGVLPTYLDKNSVAVTSDWKIKNIPEDFKVRRVEITGPVNDAKMVINMLSRNAEGFRADTAMLDFEDSMKPSFPNVLSGYKNVLGVAKGNLSYVKADDKAGKTYQLNPQDMAALMVRVRGLHLAENNVRVNGEAIHGGLLDLAVCFFHTAQILVSQKRTPKYYIPKCEHQLEARWWNDLFTALENKLSLPVPTLRATFLIETLPAAFQIEEILYEGREHIIGLNVGRWDKIFSDIKVLREFKDRISPDRAEITMKKFWMENYAKRLIKICHTRGAFAVGGMSAFTPGKDAKVREEQTAKVRADKQNEANMGHDGCWVSHPYFIGHAISAFTRNSQLEVTLPEFDKYPDLLMDGKGSRTLNGLRTNVRVGIAYLQGWRNDLGCVSWDNLMEDLATLEISRAQTWQWLHHQIKLDDGQIVNKELVSNIFTEQFEKIAGELKQNNSESLIDSFNLACEEAKTLFLQTDLKSFLSLESDIYNN
jgi:malate synthase